MENNQLTHHGILGMKWGIRRFQNKNGSLTPAGRKRYRDDADESSDSKNSGKGSSSGSSGSAKKSVKDMTDEELVAAIRRSELEKRYNDLNPRQLSAGEKFFKNVIEPAATQAGKSLLTDLVSKKGKELLGLKDDNSLNALKNEVEKMDLIKRYKDHGLDDLQREASRLKAEASIRTNIDRLNDKKNDSESKSEPEPEPEPTIKVEAEFKDKPSTKTGKKGERWVKKEPIFVDDFKDVTTTDIAVGRNYFTNNILSLPAPRDDE